MAVVYFALKLRKQNRRICHSYKRKVDLNVANISSDYNIICRICLNTGSIPIYDTKSTLKIPEYIQTFGDINVDVADNFPKHLCQDCYDLLQGAIRFRKIAKASNQALHQKQSKVEVSDCYHVDNELYVDLNKDYNIRIKTNEDNQNSEIALRSFNCTLCKLNFNTNEEYTIHTNSKQHKNVHIQCIVCRRLLTAKLYKRHLARHKSASHLICEVCGKLFRKDNLIRHLQLHKFELPYQCQLCPYRGRYVDSLKIHMRTHTGKKPFSCDKCEMRFLTRSNLNRHVLTHKKERPFKCSECGRGFYTKSDLEVHFKSDHVGIKEFGCRMCGNKYGTRKALMRHELRVHKREKMGRGRMPLYLQSEYQTHPMQEVIS